MYARHSVSYLHCNSIAMSHNEPPVQNKAQQCRWGNKQQQQQVQLGWNCKNQQQHLFLYLENLVDTLVF